MDYLLVPSQQDRLAVQRFFTTQVKDCAIWLPKIIVGEDLVDGDLPPPLSFEEKWVERFQKAKTLDEALSGEMDLWDKKTYQTHAQIRFCEKILKQGLNIQRSCFIDEVPPVPEFSFALPKGVIQKTYVCDSLHQEAFHISCLIRSQIESHRVAVVVGSEDLKRCIMSELENWGIWASRISSSKYEHTHLLSLLDLQNYFSHKALLDILDQTAPELSRDLDLKVLRKRPWSYEQLKNRLPNFLNLEDKKRRDFKEWCALYKNNIPQFWFKLPVGFCGFHEFYKIALTLLEKGKKYHKGNTTRLNFYSPETVSYLAESVVILAGMNSEHSMPEERMQRCLTTPCIYMTRSGEGKSVHWQDINGTPIFQRQRISLETYHSKASPDKRPISFSATDIETLVRDPYGFYIKRCLKLRPLGDLDLLWNSRDFGVFFHKVLEKVFFDPLYPSDPYQCFQNYISSYFQEVDHPVTQMFWKKRIERLIPWIIEKGIPAKSEYEVCLSVDNFLISARIDRVNQDGTLVDYKTGTPPTQKDIMLGYSPQLPIEALVMGSSCASLWHLGQHEGKMISLSFDLDEIKYYILKVLEKYLTHPYEACPIPAKAHRVFRHLERLS